MSMLIFSHLYLMFCDLPVIFCKTLHLLILSISEFFKCCAKVRPVSRERNGRSRTRFHEIKPTQAICRGLWGIIEGSGNNAECFRSLYSCSSFRSLFSIDFSFFCAPSSVKPSSKDAWRIVFRSLFFRHCGQIP